MSNIRVKIIECPRDAMQGLERFVPTDLKVSYINELLKVGYHTIDCGSFVSSKAIPQMRDTAEVLERLNDGDTRLSVIVANEKGINAAVKQDRVFYLGFPFSVSEQFQMRNTNSTMEQSLSTVQYLMDAVEKAKKEAVVYISMGFGNPYGEVWNAELVVEWVERIAQLGVKSFSISDTVGVSTAQSIHDVFSQLDQLDDTLEFGSHFHTRPDNWLEKVEAAWAHGCRRFDGAISGYGGCPMAADKLVGNMATEHLIQFFNEKEIETGLNMEYFQSAQRIAKRIFS